MIPSLDLDRMAERLLSSVDADRETAPLAIVEALRVVWNTRGAVDIAAIETHLTTVMGATSAGPHLKTLNRAVRALDHHTH
jgi:hypothetical protein